MTLDRPKRTEQEQADFYGTILSLGQKAIGATSLESHVIRVAGTRVRLNFAGDQLVKDFLPALAHLVVQDDGQQDVTFCVWDSQSTGVQMIKPPFNQTEFTDRGDIWGCNSERYRLAFHWSDYSVNVFDRQTKMGVYWVQESSFLPYWSKSSPMRSLFHWWMEMNECQLLHACAMGHSDGAVLMTGKGGVGKSTTSLTCLSQGLKYIADDYLIVGLDPVPTAYSLYSTAKLNADQVAKFPELGKYITNRETMEEEKATLYLYPELKDLIAESLPLKAVLTPCFNDSEQTELGPVSQDQLIGAAAFTTMSQLPYVGEANHKRIARIVETLPGFELKLGRNLPGVAKKIEDILSMSNEAIKEMEKDFNQETSESLPLISVIVPVYNGAKFLPEAIDNILSQDYPALEIIVVDDGSTEDIAAVVETLPVDVRFFRQENQGPAAARNWGIKDASGAYIAFLDVDDLWPENNLHNLLQIHRDNPEMEVVYGYAQLMDLDKETGEFNFVGNPEESFPYYIGSGLYKKSAFEKVGLFEYELIFAEDSDWYNRAKEIELPLLRHKGVTLHVRRHGENMTAGKTEAELNPLMAFKKALDRRRAREADIKKAG